MSGDLVFRAVVLSIAPSPVGIGGGFRDWVVQTRVEKVVSGDLAGDRFAFRVHSPSRAGLEVGTECTVTAKWTGTGYLVDEDQWRGAPR